jgi:hypothetical protein
LGISNRNYASRRLTVIQRSYLQKGKGGGYGGRLKDKCCINALFLCLVKFRSPVSPFARHPSIARLARSTINTRSYCSGRHTNRWPVHPPTGWWPCLALQKQGGNDNPCTSSEIVAKRICIPIKVTRYIKIFTTVCKIILDLNDCLNYIIMKLKLV